MTAGRFSIGKKCCKTKDFKFFYCPVDKGMYREELHFFWWFGHQWYIALGKRR